MYSCVIIYLKLKIFKIYHYRNLNISKELQIVPTNNIPLPTLKGISVISHPKLRILSGFYANI